MAWQEELRKLDEELAAGRLSADEYRVRRDQVLASAVSSSGEANRQQQSTAESTQLMRPAAGPDQPVQPPAPAGGTPENADKTQIVTGQGEATQAVGGWQTARPAPGDDADRTQVVPGVPPQSVVGGRPPRGPEGPFPPMGPPYGQPGWGQQQEDLSPPWAGAEFPPLVASGSPDWIKQGPELFETGGRSNKGKIAVIVLVVLLVAGLGVGAYFFFTRDKGTASPSPSDNTSEASATSPSVRPKDDLEIAPLPGDGGEQEDIKTFADVEQTEHLTEKEKQVYRVAGGGKARLVTGSLPDNVNALVITVEATSNSHAAAARDDLVKLQREFTMKDYTGTAPPGVTVLQFERSDEYPAVIRAHYTHKNTVVRVQIAGPDLAKINKQFDDILAKQLEALAADA